MHKRKYSSRWRFGILVSAVGIMVLGCAPATPEGGTSQSVTGWIGRNAVTLDRVDVAAPLDDLVPVGRSIGDAQIVGLGESTHGAAEELTLKHRILRLLVEELGFRSITWEEQWTTGLLVDNYIRTGAGDLDALVGQLSPQWRTREVADVLRWLREFNAGRADKVRFVGVEYYMTGPAAYDAVDAYVARTAPQRLAELRDHLRVVRPATSNAEEHLMWYMPLPDKQPYLDHARQVHNLVADLPHGPGDLDHTLALHHARQILSFYEHFSLPETETHAYRDAETAQNLRWWRDYSGDKIAYWAASPHTVNAPNLRIAVPPEPDMRFASAGSFLRRWYGRQYVSIGFTFNHGTVGLGPEQTVALAPPRTDWFEYPLGQVHLDQFALDLRTPASPMVRRWLEAPLTTRGLPDRGPDSYIAGDRLTDCFDVIVHRQQVTPTRPG